jgi:hypothetical protein
MSEHAVRSRSDLPPSSTLAEVGTIVLGAVLGAAGGLLAGGVVYGSLVVALFGAMGGAVAGMIGAVRHAEAATAPDEDLE